jgi:hypothetical protein
MLEDRAVEVERLAGAVVEPGNGVIVVMNSP